jgi:hypothetical protein
MCSSTVEKPDVAISGTEEILWPQTFYFSLGIKALKIRFENKVELICSLKVFFLQKSYIDSW